MYMSFVSKDPISKSALTLKLDEKEIPIDDFLKVDIASRDPSVLWHPAGRRQFIFLVDLLYLSPSEVLEARKLIQSFVEQVPKEDLVALAAITNEDGLRFFSGLTTDRSKLIAGWNAMGQVVLSGMTEGPDGNFYTANFSPSSPDIQLLPDDAFLGNLKAYTVPEKAKAGMAPLYVQAFVDLSSLLSTIDGRKDLIVFSPGTDVKGLSVDLKELSKKEQEEKKKKEESGTEDHKTIEELTELGPRDLEAIAKNQMQPKHNRESDANVVYRLLEGTDSHAFVVHPSGVENNFLKEIADKTKGSYEEFSQLVASIPRILTSDASFYVVGWHGEGEKDFHELHTLEIKTATAKIDGPTRWLAPKTINEFTPLEKKIRVAQAIYKDFGTSDHYKFWADVLLDEGLNRISTFSEVTGSAVLAPKAKVANLEFFGFSIDQEGIVKDYYHLPIFLDLSNAKLKERLQKAGLKVWNVLFSGQGPVSVRTVVMNLQTGELITQSTGIRFKDTEFLVSNPFFPSYNFDWILWPRPDQSQTRRGKEIPYPYKVGNDYFSPELSPKLRADEKGRVIYFKMYNLVPGNPHPSVQLRLIGTDGTPIQIEKFGLMQQPRPLQKSGIEVFWQIETMPKLTKGNYQFQVDVIDRKQGKEIIRDVPAAVDQ